jgi:hypothetical protein
LIFFYFLPIGITLAVIAVTTVLLYRKVYQTEVRSQKWQLGQRSVLQKVFWTSLLYVLAVYISFPLVVFSWVFQGRSSETFGWYTMLGFVHPSQGLWNSLVYFYRSRGVQQKQKPPQVRVARPEQPCNNSPNTAATAAVVSLPDDVDAVVEAPVDASQSPIESNLDSMEAAADPADTTDMFPSGNTTTDSLSETDGMETWTAVFDV